MGGTAFAFRVGEHSEVPVPPENYPHSCGVYDEPDDDEEDAMIDWAAGAQGRKAYSISGIAMLSLLALPLIASHRLLLF